MASVSLLQCLLRTWQVILRTGDRFGNEGESNEEDFHDDDSASSASDNDESFKGSIASDGAFPQKEKDLSPLPITERIYRRTEVPSSTVLPPSLIGFLRKNVCAFSVC